MVSREVDIARIRYFVFDVNRIDRRRSPSETRYVHILGSDRVDSGPLVAASPCGPCCDGDRIAIASKILSAMVTSFRTAGRRTPDGGLPQR